MANRRHTNHHHLLFYARWYKQKKQSKILRNMLVVEMNVKKHNLLHANCGPVEVPGEMTCRIIIETLKRHNYQELSPDKLVIFVASIAMSIPDKKTKDFVEGLLAQVPYLRP